MVWISRFFLAEGNAPEYRAARLDHLNPHCPGGPSSASIWAQGGAICRQQLPKPFLIRRRLSSGFRPPTERRTVSIPPRRDADSRSGVWGGLYAGLLRLQCRPQAQVSRPARRRPHNSASRGGAPRACRGHACDCDHRRGAGSPKGVYWLLDQMERRITPSRSAPVLSTPPVTRRKPSRKHVHYNPFSENVEVAASETARHVARKVRPLIGS